MQTATSYDSARFLQQEPSAMRSHPIPSPADIRIEYSTSRDTGGYSVKKHPKELVQIGKKLGGATQYRGLEGVGIPTRLALKNVVHNATRTEIGMGGADKFVRLLFNLGILIRVLDYPDENGVVLFDAERMNQWADGEHIASEPSEESLVQRAIELICSVEDQDDARPSDVHVKLAVNTDSVLEVLIGASGEEKLEEGGTVPDVVRDAEEVIAEAFPSLPQEDIPYWLEHLVALKCLENLGDNAWRIRIDRYGSDDSQSIDDLIKDLRSEAARAASRLAEAERGREQERRAAEQVLQSELSMLEDERREQINTGCKEAEDRAVFDKEQREAERIEEARKAFDAKVARIREEEDRRLNDDLQDVRSDSDERIQRISAEVEARRTERRASISIKNRKRDAAVLGPLRSELERCEADVRRLASIRDRTSKR